MRLSAKCFEAKMGLSAKCFEAKMGLSANCWGRIGGGCGENGITNFGYWGGVEWERNYAIFT
jgi:hypothetical protein